MKIINHEASSQARAFPFNLGTITLLNTSILTDYGTYTYEPCTAKDAKAAVLANMFESAIGHASTAEILTVLLGVTVIVRRVEYRQKVGELALVFKLRGRPPEGKILSGEEIEAIGYDFGFLLRTE